MKYILIIFFILNTLFSGLSAQTTVLKRRAQLDFGIQKLPDAHGASISRISENSTAYKAGLRKNDIVLTINNQRLPDGNELYKIIQTFRGGDLITLKVIKTGQASPIPISFTPQAAPLEGYTSLDLETVELINSSGDALRGFVTKPKGSKGKLPAILFVSWLSCSSVETPDREDSWTKMLREVAEKSGFLMMRVEKPGVGDSNGPACSDCDLLTELDGYKAAWRHLKQRPDVDTTNVIVFGASLGGTLASIVGKGQPVKAYVSAVSVYKTWLEHMIELERRRLLYSGQSQAEINALMPDFIEFHTEYMNYKKTPRQIALEKPHLASLWYDDPEHQYGRPAKFYMQVQDFNFMHTWSETKAPLLILAGEYDWIMSLDDSQLLVDMINQETPGRATLQIAKGMDHHWSAYPSPQQAFDETSGVYAQEAVTEMIRWMKDIITK
ncbi:MAG: PDZ domain-containing protein [Cyclobacteriaceae bacterium]